MAWSVLRCSTMMSACKSKGGEMQAILILVAPGTTHSAGDAARLRGPWTAHCHLGGGRWWAVADQICCSDGHPHVAMLGLEECRSFFCWVGGSVTTTKKKATL